MPGFNVVIWEHCTRGIARARGNCSTTLHIFVPELCWHFSWSLKQRLQAGIQVSKKAFKGFHRAARFELVTSNILPSDSSGLSVKSSWWFLDDFLVDIFYWTVPLRCTAKNQHDWGELFLIFTSPWTEIKGYKKNMQCGRVETDPKYPIRWVALFRTAVAVVYESSAQLSPLASSAYR